MKRYPNDGLPSTFEHLLTSTYHIADRSWMLLYNFLVAQSVLILAWGAILTANTAPAKVYVMLAISAIGVIISLQWSLLGTRMWQYHLEYASRLRRLTKSFAFTRKVPGAGIWHQVDAAVDRDWRDEKAKGLASFKAWSGHQVVLFFAPILIGGIHLVMFVVASVALTCWPSWVQHVSWIGGCGLTLWGGAKAWAVFKPVFDRDYFGG